MKNRIHAIVGLGEIGTAIRDIISKERNVITYDINDAVLRPTKKDIYILHICIPFTASFIEDVLRYVEHYNPKYVVIHSTVLVGTTEAISRSTSIPVMHSPVRGKHPELEGEIKGSYIKYLSFDNGLIDDAIEVTEEFEMLGIRTKMVSHTRRTELGKLLSLARYGVYLSLAKEQQDICTFYGLNYEEVVTDFEITRNQGIEENFKQPVLFPFDKYIGGHCVVENMGLLLTQLQLSFNLNPPLISNALKIGRGTVIWANCNVSSSARIGKGVSIGYGCEIGNNVVLGNDTRIGAQCFIPEGVTIGENVFVAPNVSFSNDLYPPSKKKDWKKTLVEDNASIGIGSVILPGITIGAGAMIGAGSIVTKDVPAGEKWFGSPATLHGMRYDND